MKLLNNILNSGHLKISYKLEAISSIFIYIAVVAFCLFRIRYGVSIEDEVLYISLADLPRIGGTWFVNDPTIQTTSSILFSPFIRLYTFLFGTEGVVLFSRYLYFLLSVFTSFVWFLLFRKYNKWTLALLISCLPIVFVGHSISSLYYNGLGSLLYGISLALTLIALFESKSSLALASGFTSAFCIFAYPTMFIVFCFFIFLLVLNTNKELKKIVKIYLLSLIIGGLLSAVLIFYLGIENVIKAIEFSTPLNSPGALWKLPAAIHMFKIYYQPATWILIFSLCIWTLIEYFKPSISYIGVFTFITSYLLFSGTFEVSPIQVFWITLNFTIIISILINYQSFQDKYKRLIYLLIIPSFFGSLVTLFTSLQILYNTYITSFFGSLGAIVLLSQNSRFAGWLITLPLIFGSGIGYYNHVYEDGPISELSYRLEDGPWAGLYTGKRKAHVLNLLYKDINNLKTGESILFKDQFPGGYLMSQRKPAGFVINFLPAYMFPMARPAYKKIYEAKENLPDIVVEFLFFPTNERKDLIYMEQNTNIYNESFYNFFMLTGEYKIILDRGVYRFLERVQN